MSGPTPRLTNGEGTDQGIWDVRTTAVTAVGKRATLNDGRVFYYARNSGAAALAPGKLVMAELAVTAAMDNLTVNTAVVGDTTLSITTKTGTSNANDFAEGYCVVVDDTAEGHTFKIKAHPATTASTEFVFALYDPIPKTFGDNTTVSLIKNPWMDAVISASGQAHLSVGIPQITVGAGDTTAQYYWCQTWGVSAAWHEATEAVGLALSSGATGGQVEIHVTTDQQIGVNVMTGVNEEYQPIFLTIAP